MPSSRIRVDGDRPWRMAQISVMPAAISSVVFRSMLLVPIITTTTFGLTPSNSPWVSRQRTFSVRSQP